MCGVDHYPDMPSTAIRHFDYDAARKRLNIQFVSGKRYSYFDVPAEVAAGMESAQSKGGYFNSLIRDRYRFTQQ